MAEEAKVVPGQEPAADPAKPEAVAAPVAPKEETISEVLNPAALAEKAEETVPLSALIEMKKANKELTKQMKELQKSAKEGANKEDVTADLDAIAAEYPDIDPDFLKKFAKAIRAEAKKDADAEVAEKLKPIQEKERAKSFDERFNTYFDKAIEASPEFKDVADKEVIKALSLVPGNANKTLTQLIEETFGKFVQGKRTIDAASPRGGKSNDTEIDEKRVKSDPEYFKQVMADPTLKKKYNEDLHKRLSSHL